jgi:hypothetical protein
MKKYETKPLPGVEPEYCQNDTPLLDLDPTARLLDEPDKVTPERPTRTEDGRIVGDGSVTVRKESEQPPAFHLAPPRRQDPAALRKKLEALRGALSDLEQHQQLAGIDRDDARVRELEVEINRCKGAIQLTTYNLIDVAWRDTIREEVCLTAPHAVIDALSAMRGETFYCSATEARTPVAPPCRQLASLPKYWAGQKAYSLQVERTQLSLFHYVTQDIPPEAIHEAARLLGAAKQAHVEAWVEYHQPKDMMSASLPPPMDLGITRSRIIFRRHRGVSWLWAPGPEHTLRDYLAARWIREAHLADTRSKAQLTKSIHTARPGDPDCGRRVTSTEVRNDRGEYGREVKILPNGNIDFRSGAAAPRRGATGTLGLKSYTVNRKVQFKDGTTKRVLCQKAASKVRWIKGGPDLQETVILPLRKTGPKPLFGKAMTPAEKQKRHREKKKAQAA